jgi:hypothetical protein
MPEVARSRGIDARRVDPKAIEKAIEEHLTKTFGTPTGTTTKSDKKPAWIEAAVYPWIYLNPRVCAAARRTKAEIAQSATEFLVTQPDIARAFTRADLEGNIPADDDIRFRMKRSYYPERSGDLCIVLKRNSIPSAAIGTGTTHGAPYDYDAHAPLLVYGPGIAGGTREERVTPQAAAAIFSRWLDIPLPNRAEFPVPESLTP